MAAKLQGSLQNHVNPIYTSRVQGPRRLNWQSSCQDLSAGGDVASEWGPGDLAMVGFVVLGGILLRVW